MANTSIGEFSVLSPSQKKELERKRQEQEAREAADAAKKADAARKARETAQRNAAAAAAARQREREEKESKKNRMRFWIGVLCILIVFVIWLWIHLCHMACMSIWGDDKQVRILCGILFIYTPSLLIVAPIITGIISGIGKLKEKIKAI